MNTRRWSTLVLTGLACCVVAQAQTSTTTGAVRGTVKSKKGGKVAGAILVLRSLETGLTRTGTTDTNGNYMFPYMPVGNYEITVTAPGLRTGKNTSLRVALGEAATQNFDLDSAEAATTVEVVAETAGVDTTQINSMSSISQETVEAIPVNGRNFTDLVLLTPGAATNAEGYRQTVEGARGVQNNLQIDGASFNSKFNGEQRGGTRVPFSFGQDSIRELQVITNSFDAQYGDSAGAVINAVTKSGTNDLSGSAFILFRPNSLVAKVKPVPYDPKNTVNSDAVRTRNFSQIQGGFTLGGPIIKDKLHYFLSVEAIRYREESVPAFGFDNTTGNDQAAFDAFWHPTTGFGSKLITTNDGRTLATEAKTPWTDEIRNLVTMLRVDWSINPNHRFTFRLNSQDYKGENDTWSRSRRNDIAGSQNSTLKYNSLSWVFELNSVLSQNLVNEARVQFASERRPVTPNSTVGSSIRAGSSSNYLFNAGQYVNHPSDLTELTTQIVDNVTYVSGDWTFKGGIDFQFIDYMNRYLQYQNGSWTFGSLDVAQRWYANPTSLKSSDYITYNQNLSTTNGYTAFDEKFLAGYVQAQYAGLLNKRLMLSLGARYTREIWSNNPNPNARLGGMDKMPNSDSLDPRFGFTLDLFGNSRTVLRGGYGWFSVNNVAQTVNGAIASNGLNTTLLYIQNNSTNLNIFKSGYLSWAQRGQNNSLKPLTTQADIDAAKALAGGVDVSIIDPKAKMAQARAVSLGVEHNFGNGYKGGIRGTYKQFKNLQYFVDINLWQMNADNTFNPNGWYQNGYPTKVNYFTTSAFGAPAGTSKRPGKALVNGTMLDLTGVSRAMLSKYDGEGRYKSLVLEGSRHSEHGWSFTANATFAKAEDNNSNERATFGSDSGTVPNPADPLSWANSDNDRKFRGTVSFISPSYWGVKVSGLYTYTTGRPFNAVWADDINYDGRRIDPVGERNSYRQPSEKTFDLRVAYDFKVPGTRMKAEALLDVFNVFNWANQYTRLTQYAKSPATPAVYSTFGLINMPDNRTREMQITLKAKF